MSLRNRRVLSPDDRAVRADRTRRIDRNGDGKLSRRERRAARLRQTIARGRPGWTPDGRATVQYDPSRGDASIGVASGIASGAPMNRKESKAARRAAKRAAKLASLTPEQQAKRAAKKAAKAERRAKKKEAKARALAGLGGAVVTAAAGTSFGQEVAGTFGLDTAGIGGRASDLLLGLQGFGGSSAATPGFGPSLPPLPSEAPPEGGGIMDWIKANPIMAAGGAVVLLFVARKLF